MLNPALNRKSVSRPSAMCTIALLLAVTLPTAAFRAAQTTAGTLTGTVYDPARREIFLGPNGIPEFVDCHCSEFVLYKRATDMGYTPLV